MHENALEIIHITAGVGQSSYSVGQVVLNLVNEQKKPGRLLSLKRTHIADDIR